MEKLKVQLVFEIIGRPAEHIVAGLNGLIDKLGKEHGVKVLESTVHPPIAAKDSKDMFTTFAEVTLELDTLNYLFGIVFAYMPAHVELISPEKLPLTNHDIGHLASSILHRLHDYDAVAKRLIFERDAFSNKLKEVSITEYAKLTGQTVQPVKFEEIKKEVVKKSPKKAKTKKTTKKKK